MARVRPSYSKSAINRAASSVRRGVHSAEDELTIENWRASHAIVLNTFRQTLNRHTAGNNIIVAQRLKRRSTIYDKLSREPRMNLARMHDIAGCRLIFETRAELYDFRENFKKSRFKHELLNSSDTYDYIKHPKLTGYRGVHDVYKYRSFSGKTEHSHWDGLQVEIQYRTTVQHAWATAVELFGQISGQALKYDIAEVDVREYFIIASDLLEKGLENGGVLSVPEELNLLKRMDEIDQANHIFDMLFNLSMGEEAEVDFGVNGYLLLLEDKKGGPMAFQPQKPTNAKSAIEAYFALEKLYPDENIVLVRSISGSSIRAAFPNYFRDARKFCQYLIEAKRNVIKRLESIIELARYEPK